MIAKIPESTHFSSLRQSDPVKENQISFCVMKEAAGCSENGGRSACALQQRRSWRTWESEELGL
jgi:hypothetical protein